MHRSQPRLSLVALVCAAALLAPAATAIAPLKSVGEIFVDAAGRASGQNVATTISDSSGVLEGFRSSATGTEIFSAIAIDGFAAAEKIQGVGSSSLTLRGSNAIVGLHDNLHSVVTVTLTQATSISYTLGPGVTATKDPNAGVVRLAQPGNGELGALVAHGARGPDSKGEVFDIKNGQVLARGQAGSQFSFLGAAGEPQSFAALVEAAAEGLLASQYVTEFDASESRTSQVDHGARASVRTVASAAGGVASTIRASDATVLAYDLAYETLPASAAGEVALFLDGELATRASSPREVVGFAKSRIAAFHALVEDGRTIVLASVPSGDHRVSVSVSASASTESQARAEENGESDARVYGSFEYHSNGKLTGSFLTSVIPDGQAQLISFTSLASRTEIFSSVTLEEGADATFHSIGNDELRLETSKADLTLIDDVLATILVDAKAPARAAFELAADVTARAQSPDVITLEGPHGPAGALVLLGEGSLMQASGTVRASLSAGASLVYRGAPDAHASEPAVLDALANGRVGAQVLAGSHAGALATRATSYAKDVDVDVRPAGYGSILVQYLVESDAGPRSFVLDARGSSIAAKAASDIKVVVDGIDAIPVLTPEEALDLAGVPRYHTMESLDGALRVIVATAASAGTVASVTISSTVESSARAAALTDAFGAFRLYHDGAAVGSFVTLKADQAAGAVSGFTMLASDRTIFATLAAGKSAFATMTGDGASVLRLENREARLEFSDTTSGFAKVSALAQTEAAIQLAGGLRATSAGPGVIEIADDRGEQIGSLIIVGATGSASYLETRGEQAVRAHLEQGAELLFRAHAGIETELSDAQRGMIAQAIAAGRIAGQVIVQTQADLSADAIRLEQTARMESEGLGVAAREAFGELTSAVTASYGAVSVVTAATKEKVELTVASSLHEGKTLLVSLDPDTIPGMATGQAIIRFDGEIVAQASSYADILDPSDDGEVAEYFVLAGDAGTQVLVSIPSFSVHTVTLEQRPVERANSIYMYATLFLGLLVVVESALLARGRATKKTITNNRRP